MKEKKLSTLLFSTIALLCLICLTGGGNAFSQQDKKPNILFIAIDDLNDWTGMLKGNPQALTPHMDELASQGMLFTKKHRCFPRQDQGTI